MASKAKVSEVAESVVRAAEAVVDAVADTPPDPRGFVHVRKRDGMRYFLVRDWSPREGPVEKRKPVLMFQRGRAIDQRCHIPDGCQVVVGGSGVPRLYSTHLGFAIKSRVLSGMTREEAWQAWEEENGMRREDSSDWHSYLSARPSKKVEQVVYKNFDGSVRLPGGIV